MTRSYVKIYGPPLLKGLKALETIAVDMSKETAIRYYNFLVPYPPPLGEATDEYMKSVLRGVEVPAAEKVKLISRSSETLGEYDFFFEWGTEPTKEQVEELISKIDEALANCGCKYTIVTK